jgi:hypothetical protein
MYNYTRRKSLDHFTVRESSIVMKRTLGRSAAAVIDTEDITVAVL